MPLDPSTGLFDFPYHPNTTWVPSLPVSLRTSTTQPLPATPGTVFAVPINNISTSVGASGYTAGSGALTLATGGGALFPALAVNQSYRVTVVQNAYAYLPAAPASSYTIYGVNAVAGDTLYGLLPLEGTVDRNYTAGDIVEVRVTAGTISALQGAINAIENSYYAKDTQVVHLAVGETISGKKTFTGGIAVTAGGMSSNPSAAGNVNEIYGVNATMLAGAVRCVGVGAQVNVSPSVGSSVAIGFGATISANANNSIVLGANATSNITNTFVVGSASVAVTTAYIGHGVTDSAAAASFTLTTTGGSGQDKAGSDLIIAGGQSTGSGAAGQIRFQVSPTHSTGSALNVPAVDSVKIDTVANVILNAIGSALATTATGGFTYIPTCAGTPTGVPSSLPTGAIPIVYDSTNNFLYVYNGAWKKTSLFA